MVAVQRAGKEPVRSRLSVGLGSRRSKGVLILARSRVKKRHVDVDQSDIA
jgi:hypothetical protein